MDLELQNIKQKTSALIRAYIGYYPITPTNKKPAASLAYAVSSLGQLKES